MIFIQIYSNSVVLNFMAALAACNFCGTMSLVTKDPL